MKRSGYWERVYDAIVDGFAGITAVLLVLVMLWVTMDVFLRYFLKRPQFWVGELSEYALLFMTFAGAAWVLRNDGHVKVDILGAIVSSRTSKILLVLANAIGVFVSGVITYCGLRVTADHFERGVTNSTLMEFPKGPLLAIIPIGCFLLFVEFLRRVFHAVRELRRG